MPRGSTNGQKSPIRPPFVPPPARSSKLVSSLKSSDDEPRFRQRSQFDDKKLDALMNDMDGVNDIVDRETGRMDFEQKRNNDSAAIELDTPAESHVRKLLEAEIDADEAVVRSQALEELLARAANKTVARGRAAISTTDCIAIAEASNALRSKIVVFQNGVREVRAILRQRERSELTQVSLNEQREALLRKLSDADTECARLRDDLDARIGEIDDLRVQVSRERDAHANASRERAELERRFSESLKRMRELERDCALFSDKLRTVDVASQERIIEADRLRRDAEDQRERTEQERDAANKSSAKLRERLTRAEEAFEQSKREVSEKDALITELTIANDQAVRQMERANREKTDSTAFIAQQRARIDELEAELHSRAESTRQEMDTLGDRMRECATEATSLRAENERLRVTSAVCEEKIRKLETDCDRAYSAAKRDQKQIEELRAQAQRSSRDKDDLAARLDDAHRQLNLNQKLAETEIEQLRSRFQQRIHELEPLPEQLKAAELKLQETREHEQVTERRLLDLSRLHSDLTAKYEAVVERESDSRTRVATLQDELKVYKSRLENSERRTRELEAQTHELVAAVAKRDEALLSNTSRLDEKMRENASLQRQLEQALDEARHRGEMSREKTSAREHQLHSKVGELEAQVAQAKAEAARMRRDKEELEQRLNARIVDLKDRLDQASTTNRSMQNYVHFLKNSYSNVFGGTARTDTNTMTSGFVEPSMGFDAASMALPTSNLFAGSRNDLSTTGNFSDRFMQS